MLNTFSRIYWPSVCLLWTFIHSSATLFSPLILPSVPCRQGKPRLARNLSSDQVPKESLVWERQRPPQLLNCGVSPSLSLGASWVQGVASVSAPSSLQMLCPSLSLSFPIKWMGSDQSEAGDMGLPLGRDISLLFISSPLTHSSVDPLSPPLQMRKLRLRMSRDLSASAGECGASWLLNLPLLIHDTTDR